MKDVVLNLEFPAKPGTRNINFSDLIHLKKQQQKTKRISIASEIPSKHWKIMTIVNFLQKYIFQKHKNVNEHETNTKRNLRIWRRLLIEYNSSRKFMMFFAEVLGQVHFHIQLNLYWKRNNYSSKCATPPTRHLWQILWIACHDLCKAYN